MQVLKIDQPGRLDALELDEWPEPHPAPGQVRVKIAACGINFADALMVRGQYQAQPEPPFAPGMEIAGTVDELGEGVEHLQAGQPVLAVIPHGGLAEAAVVDAAMAMPMPAGIDPVQAAALPIAYGTSHVALTHRAALQAGETLVVHGAGGGVGLTAVELGKLLGATVIATAGSADKLEAARAKGADHTIDYSQEDLRERIKAHSGGRGADVIFDPVGGDAFDASLRAIAFEGRIVVIGFASGRIPEVPANLLLVKNIAAIGLYWGRYAEKRPDVLVASLQQILRWYGEARIRPHVSATYSLERGAEAIRDLAERRAVGKLVVTPGGET